MIAYAGMSDRLPNICYYNNDEYNFQKPYSETTAKTIDEEVLKMINDQYDRAKQILLDHKEGHNRLAQLLVEREVIMAEDVEEIFGKRPWVSRTQELLEQEEKSQPKLEDMPEEVKRHRLNTRLSSLKKQKSSLKRLKQTIRQNKIYHE